MSRTALGTESNWFDENELAELRRKLPILYIDVVPVKLDALGNVSEVGLLLRVDGAGRIVRSIISGRVLVHESLRDAIVRHVEKDLGPMALPKPPKSMNPITVAEYFPTPGQSLFEDPRQHAVSLVYVVEVEGECSAQNDALELSWIDAEIILNSPVMEELEPAHAILLRRALAHCGLN